MAEQTLTSGVQELIDRLSQDGVAEGERRAEQIVADAKTRADEIVHSARAEAENIVRKAREEAEQYRKSGEEALKVACRDAVRDLAARIHGDFRERLQRLVRHHLTDEELLKRMILEITRKAAPEPDASLEILLPPDAVNEEGVRRQIQAGDQDALTDFVRGLIGEDIREGFSVGIGQEGQDGLRVSVADDRVEIDLSDRGITEVLAQHLLPRFRAIMHRS